MMSTNTSSGWHITSAGAFVDTTGKGALFLFALTEKNNSSSLRESCLQKKCRRPTVQSRMSVLRSNFCIFFFPSSKKSLHLQGGGSMRFPKKVWFLFFFFKKVNISWIWQFLQSTCGYVTLTSLKLFLAQSHLRTSILICRYLPL